MEQINPNSNKRSIILPFFLAVVTYGLLFLIIQNKTGYIPLRLVYTDIYIPIYYWLALSVCTYIYSVSNKIKFFDLVPSMLALGLFLHVYIMLLQLNRFLLSKIDYGRVYLYYAFTLETILFIMSGFFLYRKLRLFFSLDIKKEIYVCVPMALNLFYHFYRDISHVHLFYFCLHFLILATMVISHKKILYAWDLNKKAVMNFITREESVMLCVFLFSFLIRLFFAFRILSITGERFPTASDDGPTYNANAVLIMQNIMHLFRGEKIMPGAFDPGYSIFLGFIYKIFGHSFLAATVIQSVLSGLMAVAVYFIAKEAFNKRIGTIAAMLTALNQPLIMLSVILTTEALYIPLLIFSIYCLLEFTSNAVTHRKKNYLLAGGIIMGMAIITRAVILLFPLAVIFWLVFNENNFGRLRALKIFLLGLSVILISITAITYTNTGRLEVFTNKHNMTWEDFIQKEDPRRSYSNAKLIEMGVNPYRDFTGSILNILKNPVQFLKVESEILPLRLKLFLFYPNFGFFDPIFILTSTTPNQYASTMEFYSLLFLMIGFINVFINKASLHKTSLLLLIISYYFFIHVIVNTGQCARYRVPILPFFAIFAANGLYISYKRIKSLESVC